ncbi:MAG TPA: magnesium/cobalt transporter CorA [Acidimicrobiales bacterium]|nr:magnesium/cobalt transporter CorA [Acidimicrobiales bacterium]
MNGHLMEVDGTLTDVTADAVTQNIAAGTFFWLDLVDLDAEGSDLLLNAFHFHPLAVEDAEKFGQRPKLDDYDDFFYLVVHGAHGDGGATVEVHCFYSEKFLVTIERGQCSQFDEVRQRASRRRQQGGGSNIMLLYRIIDALIDSFFPVLAAFDDQIDTLEDAILAQPTEQQLGTLFTMKRALVGLRKVITPQRDIFASLAASDAALPGMTTDAERYFRDLYDHLIRISDLVDSYRDLLSGAMDTHLSTVSNRLNQVMKQLTIIATVFLPLSFVTGFFGQNFGWMINHITGWGTFVGLGIGLQILVAISLLVMFRKRSWL